MKAYELTAGLMTANGLNWLTSTQCHPHDLVCLHHMDLEDMGSFGYNIRGQRDVAQNLCKHKRQYDKNIVCAQYGIHKCMTLE